MRYTRAHIRSFGYELAPVVVTTAELEQRLASVYDSLRIPRGQLFAWTGIEERRWWQPGASVAAGAVAAAKKALANARMRATDLGALIYAGVCREAYEPATACDVAAGVGVARDAAVYDVANACLGVVNGIVDIASVQVSLGPHDDDNERGQGEGEKQRHQLVSNTHEMHTLSNDAVSLRSAP